MPWLSVVVGVDVEEDRRSADRVGRAVARAADAWAGVRVRWSPERARHDVRRRSEGVRGRQRVAVHRRRTARRDEAVRVPRRVGRSAAGSHERAFPGRMVFLVPVLRPRDGGRHPLQPRACGRVAVRRVPDRRRLPVRDRRLAHDQREVPIVARDAGARHSARRPQARTLDRTRSSPPLAPSWRVPIPIGSRGTATETRWWGA